MISWELALALLIVLIVVFVGIPLAFFLLYMWDDSQDKEHHHDEV